MCGIFSSNWNLNGVLNSASGYKELNTLYFHERDLQYDEPSLSNINLAKHHMVQFNLNSTEIEEIVENEIERKLSQSFQDVSVKQKYSECCKKNISNW